MKRGGKLVTGMVLLLLLLPCMGCEGTLSVGAYVPGAWSGPYYGGPYGAYGGGIYVGGTVPIW